MHGMIEGMRIEKHQGGESLSLYAPCSFVVVHRGVARSSSAKSSGSSGRQQLSSVNNAVQLEHPHLRFIGCEFVGLFYLVYSPFIPPGASRLRASTGNDSTAPSTHGPSGSTSPDLRLNSCIGPVSSGPYRGIPVPIVSQKNGSTSPGWLPASKENPNDRVSDSNRECYIGFSFGSSLGGGGRRDAVGFTAMRRPTYARIGSKDGTCT